jgi:hypothetical protein
MVILEEAGNFRKIKLEILQLDEIGKIHFLRFYGKLEESR